MASGILLEDDRPLTAPRSRAPGWGVVHVVRCGDRSVVSRAYATSPLRLLMPRNHGHAAWIYTSSLGGGLVDRDHIMMDVEVGEGAAAFVSTQASTKIYRSPGGTSSELQARVHDRGLLIMAPDQVVCFAGSQYRQLQRFELARGANLVALDWISSGRQAAGERWAFDDYLSRLVVDVDGRQVVHDAIALRAKDGTLAERMGRFDVLAVAVIAGHAVQAQAARIVSSLAATPIVRHADRLVAATALTRADIGDVGCLVRIAGRSVEDVGAAIREYLGFVPALLGDDPWQRKW